MKAFNRIFIAVILVIALIFMVANLILFGGDTNSGRFYRVEIERTALLIERGDFTEKSLSECEYVKCVTRYSDTPDNFYNTNSDYVIREINGELYRFDYIASDKNTTGAVVVVNVTLAIMAAVIIGVMFYIRGRILQPFARLTNIPYELSKGNLTTPVKESKNRFFGKFVWGIDLLRENMEEQKRRELQLQKEKKTLMLSLSHDIKTPLSAIKLYAKALSKGLYTANEKQLEIAESINTKADEIECYVSQIITASKEDFLSLDVNIGEFYLSKLINKISDYYVEKLSLIRTNFSVGNFTECLISGDIDRSVEVIQNIMENAIKYGDGKSISVNFSEEENCILVTVRNSGNSLDETEIPHIFESFYRGKNTINRQGSGLGLFICRQLVRKMGGEIFAEICDGDMCVTAVFVKA